MSRERYKLLVQMAHQRLEHIDPKGIKKLRSYDPD
jgi:hypothetical protein